MYLFLIQLVMPLPHQRSRLMSQNMVMIIAITITLSPSYLLPLAIILFSPQYPLGTREVTPPSP